MYIKIAALAFMVSLAGLSEALAETPIEIEVEAVPRIPQDEHVFICKDRLSLDDIVLLGFHEEKTENEVCGLIYAGELTFIHPVEDVYMEVISGEGYGTIVGVYRVQACGRSYAMAWPYEIHPHFIDFDREEKRETAYLQAEYPKGTCSYPIREPLIAAVAVVPVTPEGNQESQNQ